MVTKEVTLSNGQKFTIASLTVAQTRTMFFNSDGKLKSAEQQMDAAFTIIAASLNNASYSSLPWYRKIFAKKFTPKVIENSLSLVEFRELQSEVLVISGLTKSSEGEAQAIN